MSFQEVLKRDELVNVALVAATALILALVAIFVRVSIPEVPLVLNLLETQYTLGFVLLGLLPILWLAAAEDLTKVTAFFLAVVTGGTLLLPPGPTPLSEYVWNFALAGIITLMGVMYYRLNDDGSPSPVVVLVGILLVNFYVFLSYYLVSVFLMISDLRLLLGVGLLTLILAGIGRILRMEYRGAAGGGFSF